MGAHELSLRATEEEFVGGGGALPSSVALSASLLTTAPEPPT